MLLKPRGASGATAGHRRFSTLYRVDAIEASMAIARMTDASSFSTLYRVDAIEARPRRFVGVHQR